MLRRAHQRSVALFLKEVEKIQLTPTQFAALAKIKEASQISQNHLGRETAMDPATVQGVLNRLADRKLILSSDDPNDGRRRLWRLSEEGHRLVDTAIPMSLSCQAAILAPLSADEQSQLRKLLAKLC